jgi:hypothetical protein
MHRKTYLLRYNLFVYEPLDIESMQSYITKHIYSKVVSLDISTWISNMHNHTCLSKRSLIKLEHLGVEFI